MKPSPIPTGHVPTAVPVNRGSYLDKLATASPVSLICRLRTPRSTLPCHKERVTPARSHNGLARMIKTACDGLNITPDQLHQELEEGVIFPIQSPALSHPKQYG